MDGVKEKKGIGREGKRGRNVRIEGGRKERGDKGFFSRGRGGALVGGILQAATLSFSRVFVGSPRHGLGTDGLL